MIRVLLLSLALCLGVGCTPVPVPVDGGPAVTPVGWVSTVNTVDTVLSWVLPSADALIDGLVGPVAAPRVHLAFRIAEGSLTGVQSAIATYLSESNDGTRCGARAAVDTLAVGLEGIAAALVPTGYGVAPEIQSAVQALAAVGDELAGACPLDGGALPPSHAAEARAINSAPARRPFPAIYPPAGAH